ncbi:hypothetical protein GGS20DRAFT_430758 [Poronia punctata]|nr:hypothetical protein GGS20DRAFT_430758 [Poronia punctata]
MAQGRSQPLANAATPRTRMNRGRRNPVRTATPVAETAADHSDASDENEESEEEEDDDEEVEDLEVFDEPEDTSSGDGASRRGLATNLPPVANVQEAFLDMLKGCRPTLDDIAANGGMSFRVATICSGTEAPIFALKLIQETYQRLGMSTDRKLIDFKHPFSAEIEPFKQAYISRNAPGSIVYRNVADLAVPENSAAPTSMGDMRIIPGDIDILVAGTSCVDFSTLSSRRVSTLGTMEDGENLLKEFRSCAKDIEKSKGRGGGASTGKPGTFLRPGFLDEFRRWINSITPEKLHQNAEFLGASSLTFLSLICYISRHRPKVVLIENVQGAPWNIMCDLYFPSVGYKSVFRHVDTKDYYIPHTRSRGYLIAIDCELCGPEAAEAMATMWATQLEDLSRRASSPVRDWLLKPNDAFTMRARQQESEKIIAGGVKAQKDSGWERSELRHRRVRRALGIGDKRPLTGRDLAQIQKPYDRLDRLLLASQGARALDCLDIYYYQCLLPTAAKKPGAQFDLRFKFQVFDLSQNVDRGNVNTEFGVIGCLTPRGINMITNEGRLVSGFEALILQGMPLKDLDLTRETQDQLRDLAGNAMSTTVVGAALLSMIMALHKYSSRTKTSILAPVESATWANQIETVAEPLDQHRTVAWDGDLTTYKDVQGVLDLFKRCRRYCYCNGGAKYSTKRLLQCVACGTIRCGSCAGNPVHQFKHFGSIENPVMTDMVAYEMMKHFPTVLTEILDSSVDRIQLRPVADYFLESEVVQSLSSLKFRYCEVLVSEVVTICYSAKDSNWCFNLRADIADNSITWYLFLDPWYGRGSDLCKYLAIKPREMVRPFGRQVVSALSSSHVPERGSWKFWSFSTISFDIGLTRLPNSVNIALGNIDFIPHELHDEIRSIEGTYAHHPECDAAEDSLHVHLDRNLLVSGQKLRLFKDTSSVGPAEEDCYVVSDTSHFLETHEFRDFLLKFPPSWTPHSDITTVKVSVSGFWQAASNVSQGTCEHLQMPGSVYIPPMDMSPMNARDHPSRTLASVEADVNTLDSNYAMLLKYQTRGQQKHQPWSVLQTRDYTAFFSLLAPVNIKLCDIGGTMEIDTTDCPSCCPKPPTIHWLPKLTTKKTKSGKNTSSTSMPYRLSNEVRRFKDGLAAAGEAFRILLRVGPESGVSCVVSAHYEIDSGMLMHRARAYLPKLKDERQTTSSTTTAIDIKVESLDIPNLRFEPFRKSLKALELDHDLDDVKVPFRGNLRLSHSQQYSLAWMLRRERDPPAFTEREFEECTIRHLNTRVVGVAKRDVLVRGGALADDVGYGKTVTSLALMAVQRENDEKEAESLRSAGELDTLPLAATLVIAPKHLVKQWAGEIRKFLGWDKEDIIQIMSSKGLQCTFGRAPIDEPSAGRSKRVKLTLSIDLLEQFKAAKVIIVSKALFDQSYYEAIGRYAGTLAPPKAIFKVKGTPPPNTLGSFRDWYENSLGPLREHVSGFDQAVFNIGRIRKVVERQDSQKRLRSQVQEDFFATAPDRFIMDGAEYKATENGSSTSQILDNIEVSPLTEEDFGDEAGLLILEAFRFARVILDEASYTNPFCTSFVRNAKSGSKWVLSATPPTGSLRAVCELAEPLDVHVARPVMTCPGLPLIAEGPRVLLQDSTEEQLSYRKIFSDRSVVERVDQGHKFLAHFATANPYDEASLGKIRVTEQACCSRMTRGELGRYLDVQRDFQNPYAEKGSLATRHNLNLGDVKKSGITSPGLTLGYVASVECGGAYGDGQDLVQRRRDCLEKAGENLKRISDVSAWLIDRFFKEQASRTGMKANPSALAITKDIAELYRNILKRDADAFGGFEPLEAVRRSIFGTSDIANQLSAEMDDAQLFRYLDKMRRDGAWDYYVLTEDIVEALDEGEARQLLAELEPTAAQHSIDEVRERLLELVTLRRAERTVQDEAPTEAEAKPKKGAKGKGNGKGKDEKKDEPHYPQLLQMVKIRGGTYTETESEITNIILKLNKAVEHVTLTAKQLTAAESLFQAEVSDKCSACDSSSEPLLFIPECGHFICKSHESVTFCGHIESKRFPTGSGCSALIPKRTIPAMQIFKSPITATAQDRRYSSKTRHIVDTIKNILETTEDKILLFWQFKRHCEQIGGLLREEGISYQDNKAIKTIGRLRLFQLTSEDSSGSNLQDFNHVIFANTPIFTKQEDYDKYVKQAKGRVIRYGQKKHVQVYYFASANSFEVDLLQLRKRCFIRPKAGSETDQSPICYFEDWPEYQGEDESAMPTAGGAPDEKP